MRAFDARSPTEEPIYKRIGLKHITKEEVVNVLNKNFSDISNDLGLNLTFEYDKVLYEEKNLWFEEKTLAPTEIDFFNAPSGGYSSEEEIEDNDEIEL